MEKIKKVKMVKLAAFLLAGCFLMVSISACSKDEIIDNYNQVLQEVGDNNLTGDDDLQGTRSFGADSYVGSYSANYDGFTGTENLFGGTALERDAGNKVTITCKMDIQSGTAKLIFQSGTDEPKILLESSDEYSETIELPSASNFVEISGNNFTGSVELEIK